MTLSPQKCAAYSLRSSLHSGLFFPIFSYLLQPRLLSSLNLYDIYFRLLRLFIQRWFNATTSPDCSTHNHHHWLLFKVYQPVASPLSLRRYLSSRTRTCCTRHRRDINMVKSRIFRSTLRTPTPPHLPTTR